MAESNDSLLLGLWTTSSACCLPRKLDTLSPTVLRTMGVALHLP